MPGGAENPPVIILRIYTPNRDRGESKIDMIIRRIRNIGGDTSG